MEDYYQNYEMYSSIYFSSNKTIYKCESLQYFNGASEDLLTCDTAVMFTSYAQTAEILNRSDCNAISQDNLDINNLVQELKKLYFLKKKHKEYDIATENTFKAIAKYLELLLLEICSQYKVGIRKLYIIFIMPQELSREPDIIDLIMLPLFSKAGITIPPNYLQRILFMPHLEAALASYQLAVHFKKLRKSTTLLQYSRCIKYDVYVNDNAIKVVPTHFQFIEDHRLEVFNERYYVPQQIEYKDESPNFQDLGLKSVKKSLQQFIVKVLDLDNTIANTMFDTPNEEPMTVAEILTNDVLQLIGIYFFDPDECFDFRRLEVVKQNLSKTQIESICSAEFINTVIQQLSKLFTNQLQKVADYIHWHISKTPYFRKSIAIDGFSEHLTLEHYTCNIFVYLLRNYIRDNYKLTDLSTWHFNSISNYIRDIMVGASMLITKKAMVMNIALPPTVIAKTKKLNKIGLPLYCPVDPKAQVTDDLAKAIVYIDITIDTTCICAEVLDVTGSTCKINIQNIYKNQPSIKQFFESNLVEDFDGFKQASSVENGFSYMSTLSPNASWFLKLLNKLNTRSRLIDRSSAMIPIKRCLQLYTKKVLDVAKSYLVEKSIPLEQTGYVLCFERPIMDYAMSTTKDELVELLKEGDVPFANDSPRKIMVVDEGEKLASHLASKTSVEHQSYYVHSHISDEYMYLKLHQVVKIAESRNGAEECSTIFITAKRVNYRNTFEQISETFWNYIHSLDDKHKKEFVCSAEDHTTDIFSDYYEKFKKELCKLMKEKLFSKDDIDGQWHLYYAEHHLKINNNYSIKTTLQQLMEIAIIPVLRQLANSVISCLMDTNIFGNFWVDSLIITGNFLKVKWHHDIYCRIIEKEMEKEFIRLIRKKTHRTKLDIKIDTCLESNHTRISFDSQRKLFCFDELSQGELRMVSSATYFVRPTRSFIALKSAVRLGYSHSLILRGEELLEKRCRVDVFDQCDLINYGTGSEQLWLYKYSEPSNTEDIQNAKQFTEFFSGQNFLSYLETSRKIMITIDIKVLYYCSSIQITHEMYYLANDGKYRSKFDVYRFSEKKSLKYFK